MQDDELTEKIEKQLRGKPEGNERTTGGGRQKGGRGKRGGDSYKAKYIREKKQNTKKSNI